MNINKKFGSFILSIALYNFISNGNRMEENVKFNWPNSTDLDPFWNEWWNYESGAIGGPEQWGNSKSSNELKDTNPWKICQIGKMQSPIDIQLDRLIFDPNLGPLKIENGGMSVDFSVVNTGRDLQLTLMKKETEKFILNGGPLSYDYCIHGLKVKFGNNIFRGSEHYINQRQFPGEVQMYAFNCELYHDLQQASTKPNGIAILSAFLEISDKTNSDLKAIIASTGSAIFRGGIADLRGIELHSLFGILDEYLTYHGSLSLPPCTENVNWIILNHSILVEKEEYRLLHGLQKFQDLWSGIIGDNFRPLQTSKNILLRTNIKNSTYFGKPDQCIIPNFMSLYYTMN